MQIKVSNGQFKCYVGRYFACFMPIEIPSDRLPSDTLNALIEEFVTRPGTDYGEYEISLAEKVAQVENLLRKKRVLIVFDENTQSCDIVLAESWQHDPLV